MSADPDVDLATSTVTGEWGPHIQVLCPAARPDPEPCDCGFIGQWERRTVYVWGKHPGSRRSDAAVRRDIARGLPARAADEGWWCMAGYDERCPGCGDIERFDSNSERVGQFQEKAKVLVSIQAWRAARGDG